MHVCLYFISICYASDTESLEESASYLNVCDQENGRRYEFKSIDTILSSVKGRLKRALREWKLIDAPQFIIEITEFGYKLPFAHIPASKVFKNKSTSALVELSFVGYSEFVEIELFSRIIRAPRDCKSIISIYSKE